MGKSGSNFVALYKTIHKFNQSEHAPLTRYAIMYIFPFDFSFKLVSILGFSYIHSFIMHRLLFKKIKIK